MAGGKDNLVSLADRTTEEQREIARAGGIASGEARRRQRTLREIAEILAERKVTMPMPDGTQEEMTYDAALIQSMYQRAVTKGDTKAATFIAKILGEIEDKHVVESKGGIIILPKEEVDGLNQLALK